MAANKLTKKFYRLAGNFAGIIIRKNTRYAIDQELILLDYFERFANVKDGYKVLELGTGWVHRYSSFLRLFYNMEVTLYDVVDNRQFDALKDYFGKIQKLISPELYDKIKIKDVFEKIKKERNFEDYYKRMNFNYHLAEDGKFENLHSEEYDLIFSCNVGEHIRRELLDFGYIESTYKLLKPGGYSIHIVDVSDHLHVLDRKGTHVKEYIKIDRKKWESFFESDLKYINRVQPSEWLKYFENAGFNLVYRTQVNCEIDSLKVAQSYMHLELSDLMCRRLFMIFQKPF